MRALTTVALALALVFAACSLPPREVVKPDEVSIKTSGATSLVVVYSRSGFTAQMARALAGVLGADFQRLTSTRVPDSFRSAPSWTEQLEVTPEKVDLAPYRLVVVGGPIWMWKPNAVTASFIRSNDFTGKDVVLFYTFQGGMMSQETEDAFKKLVTDRGGKVLEIVGIDRKHLPEGVTVAQEAERIAKEKKDAWTGASPAK